MRLIAHYCGPDMYPGATIASAQRALQNGADMVECDVHVTKDGQLVISHDPDTRRVFGVDRNICDMTKTEFMALRHTADPRFPAHCLGDFFACRVFPLLLHVKVSGEENMRILCDFIRENVPDLNINAGLPGNVPCRVTLGMESVEDARRVRAMLPDAEILAFMPELSMLDDFVKEDLEYIRLWEGWETEENIKKIHDAGKKVWIMVNRPWCGITEEASLARFVKLGVDGVLINHIPWAKMVLAKYC